MSVLFIGKRFYTNRDAVTEKFGRIYQLPWHWSCSGIQTTLWLIDYHSRQTVRSRDGLLNVLSTPAISLITIRQVFHYLCSRRNKHMPSVIVASGDCYIGFLGYLLAKYLKARFVFDVYDKYDEFSGYFSPPGFNLLQFLLKKSDHRFFASRALQKRIGNRATEELIIPNGIDASIFFPRNMTESRSMLRLPLDIIFIGYFGSMEPDRGISDLIGAVQLVRKEGTSVSLLLGGKKYDNLPLDEDWITYIGNLPFERVPIALACCNLLALPYRNSPFLDMASSCKIIEYISAQRPIVATRTSNILANFSDQAHQLSEVMAEPGNIRSLADCIKKQLTYQLLTSTPNNMTWDSISNAAAEHLNLSQHKTES